MRKNTNWRDHIRNSYSDSKRTDLFIQKVEHYLKKYKANMKKETSRSPLSSLELFKRLENDAIRLRKTMSRVTPEHRMILSRGQSYKTAEEYVAFFELMTEIQKHLEDWSTQLAPIREALEKQPLRTLVRETKHQARNSFIAATCKTYEFIFNEPAVFENKAFNVFLERLTSDAGIPNEKMRRLYESAYPPELRDKNPLEILHF